MGAIPGLTAKSRTDLAVLRPFRATPAGAADDLLFSRWIAGAPGWLPFAMLVLAAAWPATALAQSNYTYTQAGDALVRWLPLLVTRGFALNIIISFATMAIGTLAGVALGLWQISPNRLVRRTAWAITQLFRNSPWLVLLFIVMLAFPFEIRIGDWAILVPDWMKAVFGLSLPIMANISEIVRGAIQSVPSGQWEAAESLAFSRRQILWQIVLPQCFKRMIPPWMNWYAILTMATWSRCWGSRKS
jgi:polar amino acid transport system permease protein